MENTPIIHVVGYYPPHTGGMEKVVELLTGVQYDNGQNVRILTTDIGNTDNRYQDPHKDVPIERLKGFDVAHTPLAPKLLIKLLQINRASIVHLHIF